MISNFQIIQPCSLLKPYIYRMFVIESTGRLPSDDLKLIVPNGCPKLVIPFKNSLTATSTQWQHVSKENKITFIGVSDMPASVDFEKDTPAGNITVEFSPLGAYRFFKINWAALKNSIYDLSDIEGCNELEQKLVNTSGVLQKASILLEFLCHRFRSGIADPIFEYCFERIANTKGKVRVKELENETGYSARWLNKKFSEKTGVGPKTLSSILRFQQYYQSLATNKEMFFLQKNFYDYFYDQAHFIKDFKRFTGHPPLQFSRAENKYDSVFYKG